MKRFPFNLRLFVLLACVILLSVAANIWGQSCPGSHLVFILRDTKGAIIEADQQGVTFTGNPPAARNSWKIEKRDFTNSDLKEMPESVMNAAGKTAVFSAFAMCNFPNPLNLKISIKNKTMDLTFLPPKMGSMESADFVVDSLGFKEGKYHMDLAKDFSGEAKFYAAYLWTSVK